MLISLKNKLFSHQYDVNQIIFSIMLYVFINIQDKTKETFKNLVYIHINKISNQ